MRTSNPKCKLCGLHETCNSVCIDGLGDTPCNVMIVTDYPSFPQDETNSHHGMERTIDFIGHNVYLTHAVSCRPPGDKKPKQSETAMGKNRRADDTGSVLYRP